jgi:hypothetical protein
VEAKWDNLFWYQRANDEGKEQLKNNTTKGFLKIFQESEDRLTGEFLEQFLDLNLEKGEFEYDAQVGLDDIAQLTRPSTLWGYPTMGRMLQRMQNHRLVMVWWMVL